MSERDFKIGNLEFKLSKMDAFRQFHIVRRMAPMLSELVPAISAIGGSGKKIENLSESEQLEQIGKVLGPALMGLSKLSDADADKVLLGLLSTVEMKQEQGNWAFLARDGAGLMFNNLELPILLQCAARAFAFNLSGFFSVLPRAS